jgi:hypothetical protein
MDSLAPAQARPALQEKEELTRLAQRSDELIRELTAVRGRMEELTTRCASEDSFPEKISFRAAAAWPVEDGHPTLAHP